MVRQVLILLLISQQLLTFHPGIYECKEHRDYYKLVLNEDSTFQFLYPTIIPKISINNIRNRNHSEYTDCGIWKYINDTLILIDSIIHVYDKSGVVGEYVDGQNYVSVTVINKNNNPFSDILVSLNFSEYWKKTDSVGMGKFEYKEIKKILSDWTDTISGRHTDTLLILSFGPDTNTGLPKFEIHNVKKTKSIEYIPILYIQIKKGEEPEEGGWLRTFENKTAHVNHFTVIQDFNPMIKKEIRIRKLPVVDNIIIFTNPSYKRDGHIIKLEKK